MSYGQPCPLCKSSAETLDHFLLDCPILDSTRSTHATKISDVFYSARIQLPNDMVKLILDPSHITPDPLLNAAESMTRDMCLDLQHKRSTLLGYHPASDIVTRKSFCSATVQTLTDHLDPVHLHPERRNLPKEEGEGSFLMWAMIYCYI